MCSPHKPMIKKPEDLKKVFANGAIPTQSDFADLIDSFVPKDQLSASDLQALRELITWWRSRSTANPDNAVSPASPSSAFGAVAQAISANASNPSAAASGNTSAQAAGTAAPPSTGATSAVVPADGNWHEIPVTSKTPGTWDCSASTVNARASYRITNHAVAVVGASLAARHLVQNVDRDSMIPWHTIQFKWLPESGSSFALNVRARSAFGPDANGLPTQIQCRWALRG
jgi:hypothetical protein